MTDASTTPAGIGRRLRRLVRDQPIIPLVIVLAALLVALELLRPGILNERWVANTIKFTVPLAILAACQTMAMLTGGIDLSVGILATVSAFVMASLATTLHPVLAIAISLVPPVLFGLASGVGVAFFQVHPLIMTLGVSLIATGCLQVYSKSVLSTGMSIPASLAWLGTGLTYGVPNALVLFVPLAALVLFGLRRTGFGRLLYALGANKHAARLSGVVAWPVYLALYMLSGLLAGIAGLLYVGLIKAPSLSLAVPLLLPSVAASVIGGTSIFGGRGGYAGTILGALILTVMGTLLTLLQMPEGSRRILFGLIILATTTAHVRLTDNA